MIRVGDSWAPSGPEFARRVRELMRDLPKLVATEGFEREYDRVFGAVDVTPSRNEEE